MHDSPGLLGSLYYKTSAVLFTSGFALFYFHFILNLMHFLFAR